MVPNLEGGREKGKYYVIAVSDNDFITQDGYFGGGKYRYADGSGNELENQSLVFEITLK